MSIPIEIDQEPNGRWIAEIPSLPGVMTYGSTREEAIEFAQVLALQVLSERIFHGEVIPQEIVELFEVPA